MKRFLLFVLSATCLTGWAEDCTFDADDADSPGFANRMTKCQTLREQQEEADAEPAKKQPPAIQLYGEGTVDPATGIAERPVVAPGNMSHTAGAIYAAREAYSLRPNAQFEESVTLAIHRLHVRMAHYCSQGWTIEKEWVEPVPEQAGDFYLHYRFQCAE